MKNTKFITKDDHFGIRRTLKEIFSTKVSYSMENAGGNIDFALNIFVNQFLPPAFYESKGTIVRHLNQIKDILHNKYKIDWVWIKRNNQFSCAIINESLMNQIKSKMVELPTYQEIEEEKQKWQAHPQYNKEEGFSEPLQEEYVQLVIHK